MTDTEHTTSGTNKEDTHLQINYLKEKKLYLAVYCNGIFEKNFQFKVLLQNLMTKH